MAERLEHVLRTLDPSKRDLIKKLVVGVAFAVPTVASYAVKDLAFASVGSPGTTVATTTFTTVLNTVTTIVGTTTFVSTITTTTLSTKTTTTTTTPN